MKKYRVKLIRNDTQESYDHEFEAFDLDDAWIAVFQFCSQWDSMCDNLQAIVEDAKQVTS